MPREITGAELVRLTELHKLVSYKQASPAQQDEFMELMYRSGRLTDNQYKNYKNGQMVSVLVSSAMVIAGVYLLAKVLEKAWK
ncbi:MAG: hypothetical protein JST45_10055 [Bacteroidetes bacterium]|nr:hypothetical protein [Bacteroidota bacterium]